MYYPWLDLPVLTAPMLIAIVALAHVFVSHYAVGGGLLLALENSRSLREGDADYRAYWKKHAKFFIGLTVVYGAITGVGIWMTIGLASPLATETLIRTFVFGWAIEWCFFFLEIITGFAFYYFWDKFSPRASSFVGWLYAFSAWISLALITAITSFMLNSSGLRFDWESTGSFWDAILNVQFLPQTVARTGGALILGAFYVLLHASFCESELDVREKVSRRMRIPSFLGVSLLVVGVVGWAYFLPESSRATLICAAATNILAVLFVGIVGTVVLLLIVGPCCKPRETSAAFATALFLLGLLGVGVAEFVREAVRKPYVVDRVVYSNQIYKGDVARLRRDGLLYTGVWTNWLLDELQQKENYSQLDISAEKYLGRESTHIEKIVVESGVSTESQDDETNGEAVPSTDGTETPDEVPGVPSVTEPDADLTTGMDGSTLFVNQTSSYVQYPTDAPSQFTPTATGNRVSAGNLNRSQTRQASPDLASPNVESGQNAPNRATNPTLRQQGGDLSNVNASPQRQTGLGENPNRATSQQQMGTTPLERARQAASGGNVPNQNIQRAPGGNGFDGQTVPTQNLNGAQNTNAPGNVASTPRNGAVSSQLPSAPGVGSNPPARTNVPNRAPAGTSLAPNNATLNDRATNAAVRSTVQEETLDDSDLGPSGILQSDGSVLQEDEAQEVPAPKLSVKEQDEKINGVVGEGNQDLLKLEEEDRLTLGRAIFLYHCNCCHASNFGYSAVAPRIVGRTKEELKVFALQLNYSHYYMPPWAGTRVEAELLAEYLTSIQPDVPKNVFSKPKEKIVPKGTGEEKTEEGDVQADEPDSLSDEGAGELSSGLDDADLTE